MGKRKATIIPPRKNKKNLSDIEKAIDLYSKRMALIELEKGVMGSVNALLSHPAGLLILGAVTTPLSIAIIDLLDKIVKPQTFAGKVVWETYQETANKFMPWKYIQESLKQIEDLRK